MVEYQILSTLPTITSSATALTTYTFVDNLSAGILYNKNDVEIAFFRDAACTDQVAVMEPSRTVNSPSATRITVQSPAAA